MGPIGAGPAPGPLTPGTAGEASPGPPDDRAGPIGAGLAGGWEGPTRGGPTGAQFRASEPGTSGEDLRGLRDPAPRASWHRGRETVCGWVLVVWSGPSTHAQPELSPAARSQLPQPGAPVGGLRTRACWVPAEAYSPSPDRGEGVLRLGRQAAQSRPPNRPCPDRPEPGLDSASAPPPGSPLPALHPGQERFSWSFTQGWPRTENRWGWAARESSPDCLHHTLGSGCCLWAGAFRPPGAPGRRGGLSPDHPTPALPTSLPAPGAHFSRLLSPHVVGAYRTLEGRQKLELAGRPGRRAIWSPVPATRWPGTTRAARQAGRQASRPLTAAGVRSLWEAPPRGSLPPRPGGFPAPAIWSPRRPARDGGTPPVPAPGGAGREGGGPRAVRHVVEAASRARRPSPPARRQRDAGGRPRTETKAWLRG
ncbi:hypothetical protein NDU88_000815 [Pleurodeles waltl]|uniref:Uncharacterized protein n=1 Tax=Pleurodeles waltl TaxID=8319 RepID=A0AAV7TG31_PLEWA|nr:hypothetical protein NDU88_000815 [Pleurodeles waltl]